MREIQKIRNEKDELASRVKNRTRHRVTVAVTLILSLFAGGVPLDEGRIKCPLQNRGRVHKRDDPPVGCCTALHV